MKQIYRKTHQALFIESFAQLVIPYVTTLNASLTYLFLLLAGITTVVLAAQPNRAPIASNVIANTITLLTPTNIIPFIAYDAEGPIVSYKLNTVPAKGTLHIGSGPALQAGAVIPASQVVELSYNPAKTYIILDAEGAFTFTYTATDSHGATSNIATYTLPVGNSYKPAYPAPASIISNYIVSSVTKTAIHGLQATGGTIDKYNITTLPAAAQGTLYTSSIADSNVQVAITSVPFELTPAQAASLWFDPETEFAGDVSFTYKAKSSSTTNTTYPTSFATYIILVLPDADGDAVVDNDGDIDDDNDGIPDTIEGNFDKDNDGKINSLDLDADNDGISDAIEANKGIFPASNFDAVTGRYISGFGANGLADILETTINSGVLKLAVPDTDFDTIRDFLDVDADNDGIPDGVENQELVQGVSPGRVRDEKRVMAFQSSLLFPLVDTDVDSLPDYLDANSDNDAEMDFAEAFDIDNDGVSVNDYMKMVTAFINRAGNSAAKNYYTVDNTKVPAWLGNKGAHGRPLFLTYGSTSYRDTDQDGLVDLYDATNFGELPTTFNSSYRVAGIIVPLPVELVSFTAVASDIAVQLEWVTASELGSHYFIIERSTDGNYFESIGQVEARQYSSVRKQYMFTDHTPATGINYYRLKQVDLDQTYTYSSLVAVRANKISSQNKLTAFPNPTVGALKLQVIALQNDAKVFVTVHDLQGKVVLSNSVQLRAGANRIELDLSSLPTGVYIAALQGNSLRVTCRIEKQ